MSVQGEGLNRGETLTQVCRNKETSSSWESFQTAQCLNRGELWGSITATLLPSFSPGCCQPEYPGMQRLRSDPGQPLLCVYFIHHEQEGRTPSQKGDTALRQGFREAGSPSLRTYRHRPYEARTSLFEERSAVSLGCATEPLSLPLHCSLCPRTWGHLAPWSHGTQLYVLFIPRAW